MPEYTLTPRAQRDMRDIWRDIAVHDERAADKLIGKLFDKFALVAEYPEMGPTRHEIAVAARLIIEGSYVAVYEPMPYGVEIVAVVHGMRDPSSWLD